MQNDHCSHVVLQIEGPRGQTSPRSALAFGDAAQDSYMEAQETYTVLFEDQAKYNAIMAALAEVIYREMLKK